jgi:hypothetical protein
MNKAIMSGTGAQTIARRLGARQSVPMPHCDLRATDGNPEQYCRHPGLIGDIPPRPARWGTVGGQHQGRRPACPRHAGTASMAALRAGHENLNPMMAIARPVQASDVFSTRLANVS